jgi:aryl-alcohol dehydrogenase-like predicted oxidoreductase
VISGASDLSQLEEVASWSDTPSLTNDEMQQIEEVWNGNFGVRA